MLFSAERGKVLLSNCVQHPHEIGSLFILHILCIETFDKFTVIKDQMDIILEIGDQKSRGLGLLIPFLNGIVGITMIFEILIMLHNYSCYWEEVRDIAFILFVMTHLEQRLNDHLEDEISQDSQ